MSCGKNRTVRFNYIGTFGNDIPVRFNYHKIAPLDIEDTDYRRISQVLNMDERYVESLCKEYERRNNDSVEKLGINVPKAKREERICCIGDSITSDRLSYFRIAQSAFKEETNVYFLDFAISGWKTSDVLSEFDAQVAPFKPTIIHILLGTNDSKNAYPGEDASVTSQEEYRRNMDRLLELCDMTGAKVILTTLPPCREATEILPNGNKPVWEIATFNVILRRLAPKHNVILNDMESELQDRLNDIIDRFDNLHLNEFAHRMIASRVISYMCMIISQS